MSQNAQSVIQGFTSIAQITSSSDPKSIVGDISAFMEGMTALPEIGPILGVFGAILGFIDAFLPGETSVIIQYLQQISKQLSILQDTLNVDFQQIMNNIDYQDCRAQFAGPISQLQLNNNNFQLYINSLTSNNSDLIEDSRSNFLSQVSEGIGLEQQLWFLINGLSGNAQNGFICNIPQAMENYYAGGGLIQISQTISMLMQQYLQGISALTFYKMTQLNNTEQYVVVSQIYQPQYQFVAQYTTSVLNSIMQNIGTNAQNDTQNLLIQNQGNSNQEIVTKIEQFLTSKYNWKQWAVIVYNPISGFNNHCVNTNGCYDSQGGAGGCNYFYLWRTNGYNVQGWYYNLNNTCNVPTNQFLPNENPTLRGYYNSDTSSDHSECAFVTAYFSLGNIGMVTFINSGADVQVSGNYHMIGVTEAQVDTSQGLYQLNEQNRYSHQGFILCST